MKRPQSREMQSRTSPGEGKVNGRPSYGVKPRVRGEKRTASKGPSLSTKCPDVVFFMLTFCGWVGRAVWVSDFTDFVQFGKFLHVIFFKYFFCSSSLLSFGASRYT